MGLLHKKTILLLHRNPHNGHDNILRFSLNVHNMCIEFYFFFENNSFIKKAEAYM